MDNPIDDTTPRTKGRGRIYDSIVDTIGDTPIVRAGPRILAKRS